MSVSLGSISHHFRHHSLFSFLKFQVPPFPVASRHIFKVHHFQFTPFPQRSLTFDDLLQFINSLLIRIDNSTPFGLNFLLLLHLFSSTVFGLLRLDPVEDEEAAAAYLSEVGSFIFLVPQLCFAHA